MKTLICSVNWLGDCIMTMPAVQIFKSENPEAGIDVLVKEKLKGIWQLHDAVDNIITYENSSTTQISADLKSSNYEQVYILPNSFRSALIPFLAGIPKRTGKAGQLRSLLINNKIELSDEAESGHQSLEYMDIFGLHGKKIPAPSIYIDIETGTDLLNTLSPTLKNHKLLAVMPGAAYGPAKMWPTEYFIKTAEMLINKSIAEKVIVLGTHKEFDVCEQVRYALSDNAFNLAGRTNLKQLTSLLAHASLTITNDSGGMHLASACGTKVIGIFGITDPYKTGPVGKNSTFITNDDYPHSRDIPRESELATECLRSITPQMVVNEIVNGKLLNSK